jgi:hypothetical protein
VLAGASVFPRPPKRPEGADAGAVVAGVDAAAEEPGGLPIFPNKPKLGAAAGGAAEVAALFDAPPLAAWEAPPG